MTITLQRTGPMACTIQDAQRLRAQAAQFAEEGKQAHTVGLHVAVKAFEKARRDCLELAGKIEAKLSCGQSDPRSKS